MNRALGDPPVMVLDNWPVFPKMVIVRSHEIAEQVARPSSHFPYSVPKSGSVERIVTVIGSKSIFFKQVHDSPLWPFLIFARRCL